MIMKTFSLKKENIERQWYVVDASDKVLGRLSTKIADRIRGKDKPTFTPHTDCLLYTSPSPRDRSLSRMPSSA